MDNTTKELRVRLKERRAYLQDLNSYLEKLEAQAHVNAQEWASICAEIDWVEYQIDSILDLLDRIRHLTRKHK